MRQMTAEDEAEDEAEQAESRKPKSRKALTESTRAGRGCGCG